MKDFSVIVSHVKYDPKTWTAVLKENFISDVYEIRDDDEWTAFLLWNGEKFCWYNAAGRSNDTEELVVELYTGQDGVHYDDSICPPNKPWNGVPIEELGLSIRSFHCLHRAGLTTCDKVIAYYVRTGSFGEIRDVGPKVQAEIIHQLDLNFPTWRREMMESNAG